ncbi:MAG: hypothetical protein PSV23_12205 [Brevundimonas sp.]|uniref:hypothetical protein n=1 Tax=Brevundimonas sp. TaxID=1871086 RepID=UPI002489B1A2|nr:hypothetical protein [Brevundimonas sp.]MDI1327545.1 hypothetical protein [Brevundimonas sp.]
MTAIRVLAAVLLLAAAPVQAQVPPTWQPRPGVQAFDPNRYQADQHRYEIDRLRARADQREALARQQEIETRLNRLRIEAARQPEPVPPPPYRALRSPEEERGLRLSAEERRRATANRVGQIDAWLDPGAD